MKIANLTLIILVLDGLSAFLMPCKEFSDVMRQICYVNIKLFDYLTL